VAVDPAADPLLESAAAAVPAAASADPNVPAATPDFSMKSIAGLLAAAAVADPTDSETCAAERQPEADSVPLAALAAPSSATRQQVDLE